MARKKEKRINLYCTTAQIAELEQICEYLGIDKSRLEDNSSGVIWEIINRVTGVLKVRNRLKLQALEDLKDLEISEGELLGIARK
jgi:hypothetical protein